MEHYKLSRTHWYDLTIDKQDCENEVYQWRLCLDASGLAALIRSVDLATNEGKMARVIGLRRKKPSGKR